jgi:hypothetical protein
MIKEKIKDCWKKLIENVNSNLHHLSSEKTLVFHFTWLLKEELKEQMSSIDFEKQLFENFSDGTYLDLYFEYNGLKIGIEFKFPKSSKKGNSNSAKNRVKCINDIKRLNYLVHKNKIDVGVFLMATNEKAYMIDGNKKKDTAFKTYHDTTYESSTIFPINNISKENIICLNKIKFHWHNINSFRLNNEVAWIDPIFIFAKEIN